MMQCFYFLPCPMAALPPIWCTSRAQEEQASWELLDPEDRPKFVPQAFDALRRVPMYTNFIKEIFERCLDLYLCPRIRKKRMHIDPESLVPQLPKPRDLQPFPTALAIRFTGHTGKVSTIGRILNFLLPQRPKCFLSCCSFLKSAVCFPFP